MIFYFKSFIFRKIYFILFCIIFVKIFVIYNICIYMMEINNNFIVINFVILIVVKFMVFIGIYVIDKKKV